MGSGGGGRGSGGGGSRGTGGRSGGGSHNRGGASGMRGPSSMPGGYGGGPRGGMPPGNPRPAMRRRPVVVMPRMGMRGGRRGFFGGGGSGFGCLLVPIALILVAVLVAILFIAIPSGNNDSGEVTKSTVERQPLPAGSVVETGYYTDELGWINNSTKLTAGMSNFYKATGVQPHIYLTDTVDGSHIPSSEQLAAFASDAYEELFEDEAHLLVVFFEYEGRYATQYVTGTMANSVLDREAMDILMDCIDRYYGYENLTDEEFLSRAFDEAGERIMTVTRSPWIPVLIVAGILAILVVVFIWWRNVKKQKNLEAEQTQKILETPLESFGDTEADNLSDKYKDK